MTTANDATNTMRADHDEPGVALLDATQAGMVCGIHRATVFKLVACGKFPRPVKLGRSTRWVKDELNAWIAAKCPSLAKWESIKDAPLANNRCKT